MWASIVGAVVLQGAHRFGELGTNAWQTVAAVCCALVAVAVPIVWLGSRRALAGMGAVAVGTLALEAIASRTDFPFGPYDYTTSLQPQFFGVPVVVCLAWVVGGLLASGAARFVVGSDTARRSSMIRAAACGLGLLAWDVALDPHMILEGNWVWSGSDFFRTVPLENFVAWFVVGTAVGYIFDRTIPWLRLRADLYAYGYVWLIGSSALAFATFLEDPIVGFASLAVGSPLLIGIAVRAARARASRSNAVASGDGVAR